MRTAPVSSRSEPGVGRPRQLPHLSGSQSGASKSVCLPLSASVPRPFFVREREHLRTHSGPPPFRVDARCRDAEHLRCLAH
jgi:hypothetical protein